MNYYKEFKRLAKPLSHFRVMWENCNYYHDYLVLGILEDEIGSDHVDAVTVAHYSSSTEICCGNSSNLDLFLRATHFIKTDGTLADDEHDEHKLFDFGNLYHVRDPNYPTIDFQEAYVRLDKRMGERLHNLSWNN